MHPSLESCAVANSHVPVKPNMPRTSFTSFASLKMFSAAHFAAIGVAGPENCFRECRPGFAADMNCHRCSSISKAQGGCAAGHGHRKGVCDVQVYLQFPGISGAVPLETRFANQLG